MDATRRWTERKRWEIAWGGLRGKGARWKRRGGHMGISQGEGYSGSPGIIKSQELFMFGSSYRHRLSFFSDICVGFWKVTNSKLRKRVPFSCSDVETGQGSSGLRQAGGGLGVRTIAGFENRRVKRRLVISKSSSSNPRFLGDFGSFVLFSLGFNMVQRSQPLFGKRPTDTYEKMDERCHVKCSKSQPLDGYLVAIYISWH